jgi:hypothetical protein
MYMRKANLFLFAIFAFFAGNNIAQQPTPAPEPKANSRPTPAVTAPAEPFDKADVKTMAAQCVALDTEAGLIEAEMYPEHAPESVRNFLNLAATGLFDGTSFDRVVPKFVIQGGNMWSREGGTVADRAAKRLAKREGRDVRRPREPVPGVDADVDEVVATPMVVSPAPPPAALGGEGER